MKTISETASKELVSPTGNSEGDIDFSDIPATSEQDWSGATRSKFYKLIEKHKSPTFPDPSSS